MLHRPQLGPQRPHPGRRTGLEADDDRILVEQRERPLDQPVPPVAVRRLQLDHHPDPAPAQIEHLRERRESRRAAGRVVRDDQLAVGRACTSSSTKSAPISIARSNAGSVFSGSSAEAPRWAITSGRVTGSRRRRTTSTSIASISSSAFPSRRRERSAHGDAAHPGPGRRGDPDSVSSNATASAAGSSEQLERPEIALGMRLSERHGVGRDDRLEERLDPGGPDDRDDLGERRPRDDRHRHSGRRVPDGFAGRVVDRRAVGDELAVAPDRSATAPATSG